MQTNKQNKTAKPIKRRAVVLSYEIGERKINICERVERGQNGGTSASQRVCAETWGGASEGMWERKQALAVKYRSKASDDQKDDEDEEEENESGKQKEKVACKILRLRFKRAA